MISFKPLDPAMSEALDPSHNPWLYKSVHFLFWLNLCGLGLYCLLTKAFFFFFLINFFLFIYLFSFGCVGSSLLHAGFSLVVASGGYSVAVSGLLTAVASLVAEHGL